MPYWTEVIGEIQDLSSTLGLEAFDAVRRQYLERLSQHTQRNTILYATCWTQKQDTSGATSINFEDIQGLMAVMPKLKGESLDLIIHSPGGSAEAVKGMVDYLRMRFKTVRTIVPNIAMSAASMLACSGNSILMGKHSFLGPIDPQMILPTSLGTRSIAAQRILQQFNLILNSVTKQPALFTLLNQYGPDLLIACEHASLLSKELVSRWLQQYMFANDPAKSQKSSEIVAWLGEHDNFKSHGMTISREELKAHGLIIEDLEVDPILQDLVLSVFHATTAMFQVTAALKIIENQDGLTYMKFDSSQPIFDDPFSSSQGP